MQNHTVPFFVPLFLMAKKKQWCKNMGKNGSDIKWNSKSK